MRNYEIHPPLNEVKPLANRIDFKKWQVAHSGNLSCTADKWHGSESLENKSSLVARGF